MEGVPTAVKDRLKKKLNKRNVEKLDDLSSSEPGEPNIFDMLAQVSSLLKTNPDMVSKVNKCVSKINYIYLNHHEILIG